MAPERLEGHQADSRSDIFALGALLYEMVTGEKAFGGRSKTSIIAALAQCNPPAIDEIVPGIPPALDHIVRRCVAREPDDRWQSAHDVAAQLQFIHLTGSQSGILARYLSVPRKWRPTFRRGAGGVAAVAAIAAIAFMIPRVQPPPPERALYLSVALQKAFRGLVVALDPVADPAQLRELVDIDSPDLLGVSGEPDVVARLTPHGARGGPPGGLALVDPRHHLVGWFTLDTPPATIAGDLKALARAPAAD